MSSTRRLPAAPDPTPTPHRIRWFAYAGRERIPATATMRGLWGWDATCSCGWDSRTGGATRRYVKDQVWLHKFTETRSA